MGQICRNLWASQTGTCAKEPPPDGEDVDFDAHRQQAETTGLVTARDLRQASSGGHSGWSFLGTRRTTMNRARLRSPWLKRNLQPKALISPKR